ncbi:regulatory protein [Pullulanibacillus pueri]|uniref:Regulatory protein RecX n=1 Tax=Pullulanibacillus pueri TaxID=1437324 RepID=A0A8J3ENC7_9BACL|nr:recombination regulator RecX [Pullulanibacillus pueri]MBM7680704.1 regulatory protein [Pullulanibacillus pueri]GGH87555.1 regulatory protein RecX [Pullulanibacillus pueri]
MIRLEKITAHPKKKDVYTLEFVSEWKRECLDVHEDVLVKKRLLKGLELTEQEFRELKRVQEANAVYLLAINYLSYRIRTEKEIYDYLEKKEADPSVITETIHRLKTEKLIDDKMFSEMFVRTRKRNSVKGPRLILQELMQKGVAQADAEPAIHQYSFSEQYDNAMKFAEQRLKASDKLSNREKHRKIGQGLLQKGFDQAVIQTVLKELPEANTEDAEWEALVKQADKAVRKYQRLEPRESTYKLKQVLYRKGFTADLIQRYIDQLDQQEEDL